MYTGKDPALKAVRDAERKTGKHRYYMDGIDWVAALHRAARAIGEGEEEQRTATFLRDSSREAAETLGV